MAGEFIDDRHGWQRVSETWPDPDLGDPDLPMDLAARLTDYITALEPLRPADGRMLAMTDERIELQRPIPAAAADIFKIVSDPAGHVAIDATGMLQSFTGEPATKVGDEFVIHMDRESLNDFPLGKYDVTVRITTFEQDKEIAWTIDGQIQPPIGHIYGYRLDPGEEPGTTLVTEYYDWSDIHPEWKERNIFPIISELAIRATLGILERTVRVGLPPGLRA